jgi:hypothetical protein
MKSAVARRRSLGWFLSVGAVLSAFAGCGPGGKQVAGDAGVSDADPQGGPTSDAGGLDVAAGFDAPGVPPDAGAGGPADAFTAASVCREAIAVQCRRRVACGGADMSECIRIADHCPFYYFNSNSNRTVADIQACLPALEQMTCTDIAMGIAPACLRQGKAPAGAACLYSTECQFGCVDGIEECGTCYMGMRVGTGETCGGTRQCDATDFCHAATKVCTPRASIVYAAQDQPCDFAAQPAVGCRGDLICARATATSTAGTCRPVPQLGQACAMSGDVYSQVCGPGLRCTDQMTCQVPPPGCGDGGVCDPNSFCRERTGAPACVPRVAEGQPCNWGGTSSEPEIQCELNIWCVLIPGMEWNGICTRPGMVGDACDAMHPCAGGLCGAAGRCTSFDPAACQVGRLDAGTD